MLFMISAFIRCLFYFKHGSKENQSNELIWAITFGVLSIITVLSYIGVIARGYWELLAFMLPFECLYIFLYFKLKEE